MARQRNKKQIVEVSFRFLDGIERIHPALVISADELQCKVNLR